MRRACKSISIPPTNNE
jgi:hypothetical protein